VVVKIELDKAHRSRGYGSAVIRQLRAKAREKGCRELVFQGVRAANRRAIKLYESLGAVAVRTSGLLCDYVVAPP
jgi:ribosomal protein S18 acetylase RimI-like enzyme